MKYFENVKIKSVLEEGQIEGYASVFEVKDKSGDIVVKSAFSKAVEDFNKSGKKPKLLWQHDQSHPIGVIDEMFEDDHGLFIKAHLLLDIPRVNEIYLLLKNKAIDGFSIGYRLRDHYVKNGTNFLTDIDLLEISVVTFPACTEALVDEVKSDVYHNKFIYDALKDYKERTKLFLPLGEVEADGFSNFIRYGVDSYFTKSLNEQADKDGAIFLPKNILMRVEEKLKYLSPMRNIARATTISSNSIDIVLDSKLPDAGWLNGENERVESDSPEVRKVNIPVYELYTKPKANQMLLDDAQINVEEWLIDKIAEKFAAIEDDAFINGDGNDKPKGFLKCQMEENEVREGNKLQVFKTGANGAFTSDESALNILIDMVCSLQPLYIKNAKWIMPRSALSVIRKLKNRDGVSIWQPAVSEATPATLLGYSVIIDDNMPALRNNNASMSIAFGDFFTGYQIVDRQGLSILRDPYTSKPFVEFYATKRVGGDVVDFDAIKVLNFAE